MIGETISHYRILSHLGQGGMGAVYLAEDVNLGRKVALKVMLPEIAAHEHRLKRFLREAKLSSSINHPNVVGFYEIGEDQGTHFLAIEYIEGVTLRTRLMDGPLSVDEAVRIARQVAEALIAAHRAGVIHRDIKPENVMIAADGHVKVLDFGLARRDLEIAETESSEDAATKTQLSMVGQPIGTVSYMSPEQLRGQSVDGRSDVFSLGVLLYEMLAGRRPFEAKSSVGTIQRILTTPPDAIARFNYDVPGDVERVIRKCLEKDPEWRYQSARELAIDLASIERGNQSGVSSSSGTGSPIPLVAPGGERSRRWWLVAGVAALVTVAAAIAFAVRSGGGKSVNSLAILPFVNASGDSAYDYLASSLPDAVQRTLARVPTLSITSRGAVRSFPGSDPIAAGKQFGVDSVLTGRIGKSPQGVVVDIELVSVGSSAVLWSRRYERPESELQDLEEALARDVAKFLRPNVIAVPAQSRVADSAAFALYLKGRYHLNRRSLDDLNAAARCFREAVERDPDLALAHAGLADTYVVLADFGLQPPATLRRQAKTAARRAIELDPLIAEAQTSYAMTAALDEYNWAEAERGFRRAIDLDPTYAQAHSWFAVTVLAPLGRQDEALIEIDRAIGLEPQNPVFRLIRSIILFSARRFAEAADTAHQLGDNLPPALKMVQSVQIGESLLAQGQAAKALAVLEKAAPDRGQVSVSLRSALAHAYARLGRTKEALALDEELEKASKFEFVAPCSRVPTQIALRRPERAMDLLEQCHQLREATFVLIKVEPRYDPLRTRPEFQKLVKLARLE